MTQKIKPKEWLVIHVNEVLYFTHLSHKSVWLSTDIETILHSSQLLIEMLEKPN